MKPRYTQVMIYLQDGIKQGTWQPHQRVPSENELTELFDVSRMTARRALQELADAGQLYRRKGMGSFVSPPKHESQLLSVNNIEEEAKQEGFEFKSKVLELKHRPLPEHIAEIWGMPVGTEVFHSLIIHFEDNLPVQIEERYVNPEVAPEYLFQNYHYYTPNSYLMKAAPLTQVDQTVEAIAATEELAQMLRIQKHEPCLKIVRMTWSYDAPATYSKLVHPGSRYKLTGRFKPEAFDS
jgi:GntR family transcriptional regulator, histidine utilization repressor